MHVSIELLQAEGGSHNVKEISDLLNVEFQRIKKVNPHGFMDQWESQIENLAQEVAVKLGAEFDYMPTQTGVLFFYDWTRTGGAFIRQRMAKNQALQTV